MTPDKKLIAISLLALFFFSVLFLSSSDFQIKLLDVTGVTCTPGEQQCNNGITRQCNSDAKTWNYQNCPVNSNYELGSCNDAGTWCAMKTSQCTIGEVKCSGQNFQRCTRDSRGILSFTTEKTCSASQVCDISTICKTSTAPEACISSGQVCGITSVGTSNSGKLCCSGLSCDFTGIGTGYKCVSAGVATPCNPGEVKCSGQEFQRCNSEGTAFKTERTCGSNEICDVQKVCTGSPTNCVAAGNSCLTNSNCCQDLGAYTCQWDVYGGRYCKLPGGGPTTCNPGEVKCSGKDFQRCNAEGTAYSTERTCGSDEVCDVSKICTTITPPTCTTGQTKQCTVGTCAGTQTCVNSEYGSCVKNDASCGTICTTIENCPTGYICDAGKCIKSIPPIPDWAVALLIISGILLVGIGAFYVGRRRR